MSIIATTTSPFASAAASERAALAVYRAEKHTATEQAAQKALAESEKALQELGSLVDENRALRGRIAALEAREEALATLALNAEDQLAAQDLNAAAKTALSKLIEPFRALLKERMLKQQIDKLGENILAERIKLGDEPDKAAFDADMASLQRDILSTDQIPLDRLVMMTWETPWKKNLIKFQPWADPSSTTYFCLEKIFSYKDSLKVGLPPKPMVTFLQKHLTAQILFDKRFSDEMSRPSAFELTFSYQTAYYFSINYAPLPPLIQDPTQLCL